MQLATSTPPTMTMEISVTPSGRVPPGRVRTIEEASAMFCALRDRLGAGSSELSAALIRDEHHLVVAHVSYNGRVWWGPPDDWRPDANPIFTP